VLLDSNPAPSGSHAQAVTLSVCLLKVLTHSPVLTWWRWGALTWGLGLHRCLARWGLGGNRLPEFDQPIVAASEQLRVVRTPCHERKRVCMAHEHLRPAEAKRLSCHLGEGVGGGVGVMA